VAPRVGDAAAASEPALKVTNVFPPVIAVGSQPHVTVVGSGFGEGTTASVSGLNVDVLEIVLYSEQSMSIVMRVHHNAPLTARTLVLQNPGGEIHRCHDCLTVVAQPTSTDAIPEELGQGVDDALFLVHGTGFDKYVGANIGNGVQVRSAGSANPSGVILILRVAVNAPPGPRDIEIRNYSYGRTVCHACLVINPRPTFGSIEPSSLAAGTQHATVTVRGTGFAPGMVVAIGERGVHTESIDVVSETEATVTISVSASARHRSANVVLENDDQGRSKTPLAFTVT
jgi:hypothetical protein